MDREIVAEKAGHEGSVIVSADRQTKLGEGFDALEEDAASIAGMC